MYLGLCFRKLLTYSTQFSRRLSVHKTSANRRVVVFVRDWDIALYGFHCLHSFAGYVEVQVASKPLSKYRVACSRCVCILIFAYVIRHRCMFWAFITITRIRSAVDSPVVYCLRSSVETVWNEINTAVDHVIIWSVVLNSREFYFPLTVFFVLLPSAQLSCCAFCYLVSDVNFEKLHLWL